MYKAAIIGLGNIGLEYDLSPNNVKPSSHVLGYSLNKSFELVCAADFQEAKEARLKMLAPNTKFYSNLQDMLKENVVDIISICTPPQQHLENILYVLENTNIKNIFCEKPIACSLQEAELIKKVAKEKKAVIIPNISRRWNKEMQKVKQYILSGEFGTIQKIHVKYTRGIYNTGAHLFDLLKWWIGNIEKVQVIEKIYTSSEQEEEVSFSFNFYCENNVIGYAEAFDDTQYYFFDVDFYFSQGKIEFKNSGDEILYFGINPHHLFSEFNELCLKEHKKYLLQDSCMENAIDNLKKFMDGREDVMCMIDNAVYPLYIAKALLKSYKNNSSWERIDINE